MARQTNRALLAAGIVAVMSAAASAQSYTWSGTSTDFNLGTNWSGTSVPSFPVNNGTMTFVGSAPAFQPQLTASGTIGVLSFGTNSAAQTWAFSSASSDYVLGLTGGQVVYFDHNAPATISANLAFLGSASGTQTIGSNANLATLSGVLSGSVGTLRLEAGSGNRNVTISGTNNSFSSTPFFFNGPVNVARLGNASQNSSLGTSGTLVFGSGGYLASSGTGESSNKYLIATSGPGGLGGPAGNSPGFFDAILSGGASNLSGSTATLVLHGSGTMSGKITQTVGSGSLSVTAGGGSLTLSNTASDFAGLLSVRRGTTLITPMFGMTGSASPLGTNGRVMLSHDVGNSGNVTLRFSGGSDTSDKTFTLNFATGGGTLDTGTGTLILTNTAAWGGGGAGSKTITLTGSGVGSLAAGLPNSSSGSNSLVKSGSGSWAVSGANTFTGATSIQAGTLTFAKRVALYNGGTASWTKANINTTASGTATLGLGVGGADGLTTDDVTTLITNLSGDVSTGGMRVSSSWGFDTTNTGSTFTVADTIANTTTGGGAIGVVKLGSGTLALSGTNTYTFGTRIDGGVLTITNTAALGSGTGFLSFTGGTLDLATLTLTRDGAVTATAGRLTNGVLTGSAGLTKSGGGTFRIDSTANTFRGATAIQEGVVEVPSIAAAGVPSSLGSGTGANATVNLGNLATSGTFRYVGTSSATTNRTFNLSGTSGGGAIENNGDGPLVISSPVTATGAGTKTLVLGGTSTAANTMGVIGNPSTGALSVVKDGPGLWQLTGVSTFTGDFTVRNGTVVAATNSNSSGDSGVFGATQSITVGDATAGATGTAALLLAAGVNSNRRILVPATAGGSQAVVIGSQGTSGTPASFDNEIRLSRAVTLVAATSGTTNFSNFWYDGSGAASPTVNVSIGSSGNLGTVLLRNNLTTTGSVGVRFGTLNVDDVGSLTAAGIVGIDSDATIAGVGTVAATLGGAGFVAPGNSPGILTAQAVDPTGGLDFNFEFSGTAPTYGTATASVNDVLRLTGTGASPFTTDLTGSNAINVYLDVASLADGNTFRGGFFTDLAGDFKSRIADATYTYWVSGTGAGQTTYLTKTYVPLSTAYPSLLMDVTTVSDTATFAGGSPTSGQVTQFTVVVPEPAAFALAALGLGLAGWALCRRRAA